MRRIESSPGWELPIVLQGQSPVVEACHFIFSKRLHERARYKISNAFVTWQILWGFLFSCDATRRSNQHKQVTVAPSFHLISQDSSQSSKMFFSRALILFLLVSGCCSTEQTSFRNEFKVRRTGQPSFDSIFSTDITHDVVVLSSSCLSNF